MQFLDVLIKKKFIGQDEASQLLAKSKETGVSLEKLLKVFGISDLEISNAKSEVLGINFKTIKSEEISYDLLKQIPEEAARHYKFVPLSIKEGVLEIGMVDPENIEAKEAIRFIVSKFNTPFNIFIISEDDFNSAIEKYRGLSGEVTKVLGEFESALIEAEKEFSKEDFLSGEVKFTEEAPVTKMVAVILKHAISGNASDIHIEPLKDNLRVRFRVDGVLYTSLVLPIKMHEPIVLRIKILTKMKLDEKRKPQDGRFDVRIEGRDIDFRVSTFPSFFGEKIVIRILDKQKGIKSLDELGFSGRNLEIIRENLKKPYGLILLTGPTGSGKTTTLYSMLQELDREKNNVISLEDPIEYTIEGVSQSQVKPEINYDFANGLRSILRQDPDMIMVGEIRDKETASLTIQAALTVHLVFATLHTNNTAGIIPRLVDMDIDPFLIAPSFIMAIGQRLIKKLCPDSKKQIPFSGVVKDKIMEEIEKMPAELKKNLKIPEYLYQGIPTALCPRGSIGRVAAIEILIKTPELERIILKNPSEEEIFKEARRQGMFTMREDGILKLFDGVIGIEELNEL